MKGLFDGTVQYANTKQQSLINSSTVMCCDKIQQYLLTLHSSLSIKQWVHEERMNNHHHRYQAIGKTILQKVRFTLNDMITNRKLSTSPISSHSSHSSHTHQKQQSVINVLGARHKTKKEIVDEEKKAGITNMNITNLSLPPPVNIDKNIIINSQLAKVNNIVNNTNLFNVSAYGLPINHHNHNNNHNHHQNQHNINNNNHVTNNCLQNQQNNNVYIPIQGSPSVYSGHHGVSYTVIGMF